MKEFSIGKNEAGQRLDKYLKKLLCHAPASFIYKMLRKKNIVLNDKKADGAEKLHMDDKIRLYFSDETFEKFSNADRKEKKETLPDVSLENLPFAILYETEDMLAVNKPVGMLSQKAKAEDVSANEYILSYLLASGQMKAKDLRTFRPSVCNRLDRNTSGVLLAGKTLPGLQNLSEKIKTREIKKYYLCIVEGSITKPCRIKGYLRKDEAANTVSVSLERQTKDDKWIETEYEPIENFSGATMLKVDLITGRTHQIRAHLASIGHPIVGDVKYGAQKRAGLRSFLLHAHSVILDDGTEIIAPLPAVFLKIMAGF